MKFCKLQGAGNDFIIIDNMQRELSPQTLSRMAQTLCRRRLSIGADALIAVEPAAGGADFAMRFINADGTEAEMCGNGARCLARYAFEMKLAGESMRIETAAGIVEAWRLTKRRFRIKLNDPAVIRREDLLPAAAGMSALAGLPADECFYVELGQPGIPHVVVKCRELEELDADDLQKWAKALRRHERFPKGANVNFCRLMGDGEVRVRTFERGVEDFTLACGTGCGSVVTALLSFGLLKGDGALCHVDGGELEIRAEKYEGENKIKHIYLIGDTDFVASGEITDDNLDVVAARA